MKFLTIVSAIYFLSGCTRMNDKEVYTLYRTSLAIPDARLHMATFDSKDGASYNSENCEVARSLFQAQPGVLTRFFCELGYYK